MKEYYLSFFIQIIVRVIHFLLLFIIVIATIIIIIVIILNVIIPNVIIPNVIILNVIILKAIILVFIIVLILAIIILVVIIIKQLTPFLSFIAFIFFYHHLSELLEAKEYEIVNLFVCLIINLYLNFFHFFINQIIIRCQSLKIVDYLFYFKINFFDLGYIHLEILLSQYFLAQYLNQSYQYNLKNIRMISHYLAIHCKPSSFILIFSPNLLYLLFFTSINQRIPFFLSYIIHLDYFVL